jgi:hypothetical protein
LDNETGGDKIPSPPGSAMGDFFIDRTPEKLRPVGCGRKSDVGKLPPPAKLFNQNFVSRIMG